MAATASDNVVLNGTGSGFAPGNSAAINLKGGKYAIVWNGTGTGSSGLQRLCADGVTYVACYTALTTTTGFTVLDLPQGQYRYTTATFTAGFVGIVRIGG